MKYPLLSLCVILTALSGCNSVRDVIGDSWVDATTPDWISEPKENNPLPSPDRIDVIHDTADVNVDGHAIDGLVLSPAQPIDIWPQEGGASAQTQGHMTGSLLKDETDSITVGEGNDWLPSALAPSPIVTQNAIFVMDGHGVISAHKRGAIGSVLWVSDKIASDSSLLTGGLAATDDRVFGVTGHGSLAAFDAKTGKKLWLRTIGEPIRSALRLEGNRLFVTTAESRLLVYDTDNGTLLWQHRGIGEATNLFGGALPVIDGDGVVIAYPSGEMFRLNSANGEMVWSDMLSRPRRTQASGLFAGVDANPVSDGRLVYAASTSGLIVADDVRTGQRVWELALGTRHSPWLDDALLWMVTDEGKLVAINKMQGEVGWIASLEDAQEDDASTTRYYGPFLLNDTIIVLDNAGTIHQYSPLNGKIIRTDSLMGSIASSPAFAGKAAYIMSNDATLRQIE